ncbi:GNAT family N-acetyltransferase [Pseudomonas promysalinigenes]|uniref:GNAT family N-acetyltransferase n=1 Tax=Pseudomonas promysalinigenes TaxID=485898 RepID=A0ABY6AG67_9PSED|nr:GNAT family N-acetyltransferase [Pseudomonas promysalinigenes]UXH37805.1 GNAT family N-acetyltransferase [Pseudomonas promysalinigenes]
MHIRPTLPSDISRLIEIEHSAAQAFRQFPELAWLAGAEGLDRDAHTAFIAASGSWLAGNDQGQAVGFVCLTVEKQALHVHELSVGLQWQGKGIGRCLLDKVRALARLSDLPMVTLTTFAHVPWNGPFYAKYGFEVLEEQRLGARLRTILATERAQGLPRRCAMGLLLSTQDAEGG